MKNQYGFTRTELIIVVVAMGMPHFGDMVADNRRAAEVNRFVTTINLARTEALKRRTTVSVCTSTDGATCNAAVDWEAGWIVFVNLDGDNPPTVGAGETVLRVSPQVGNNITVRGFGDFANDINYGFDGYPELAATSVGGRINFCDDRGAPAARAVLIANTGRARLSTDTDADGIHEDEANNDLVCP